MTKYSIPNIERETTILFNEAESVAECYTCNKAVMKRLDGYCEKSGEISLKRQDEYSKTYTFPKKWIKIFMPRIMSEKQLAQLEKMRQCKKDKTSDDKQ